MREQDEVEERFYQQCAELLGNQLHEYRLFECRTHHGTKKRTRWNNRHAGNGRYPGQGIIRLYGDTVHMSLHTPRINRVFPSREAALDYLATLGLRA